MVSVQYAAEPATRARRGTLAPAARPGGAYPVATARQVDDRTAFAALASHLEQAATLELGDDASWSQLTAQARVAVDRLIARGVVPDHLAVRHGEPAVVVRRTIAAAWRHASDTLGED